MKERSQLSPSRNSLWCIALLLNILSTSRALSSNQIGNVDTRPHEQRVEAPRKARRLNHSFQHLYRHDGLLFDDGCLASSSLVLTKPEAYLKEYGGFSSDEIDQLSKSFPPLLELDVKRHLVPKMRFLKYTLMGKRNIRTTLPNGEISDKIVLSDLAKKVPPQYFGARLEKSTAPMHAFLIHANLPHGPTLLQDDAELMREFLISCRHTKTFCAMCNKWRKLYGDSYKDEAYTVLTAREEENQFQSNIEDLSDTSEIGFITPEIVDSFNAVFQRGLMAAARNNMDPLNQHLKNIKIRSDQIIHLLIRSGANPLERDVRDVSLLHWAAGSGSLFALKELICSLPGGFEEAIQMQAKRDGASIFHWAGAGANAKDFGSGGHLHICNFLIDNCDGDTRKEKEIVNALTKDGNSVLMWAAWSKSIEIVKLLIRHRADSSIQNRNGCTVAHWASSGGSLEVCKYLYDTIGLDFSTPNYAGNTPLSHAVAYGRTDIINFLREELSIKDLDDKAYKLALDFTVWESDDNSRKQVFNLFNKEVL